MSDFVWILAADKDTSFGARGVSASYIIPRGDMKISPKSLSGHRLWVLLRGNDDRNFLSLKIRKMERIIGGYHNGDFVASTDLLSSFRLVSKYSEASKYITQNTKSLGFGISEINTILSNNLSHMVVQQIEVRVAKKPNMKMLSGVDNKTLPQSGQLLAKAALREVVSHFNLDEIWAEGTGKKLHAFPNFANELISNRVSPKNYDEIVEFLKFFDPLKNLQNNQDKTTDDALLPNLSLPKVDIDFTKVNPKNIHARKFISSEGESKNLEDTLIKAENAEKMHQEMLKDIAEFLISKGVTPYESESVDLMYQSKNKMNVCEIKSATLDNLFDQSSRGAFQLTRYIEEIEKNYDDIFPQLILRKTGNREMESYVKKILLRMNIPVLYYDPNKPWPNKLPELLS